MSSTINTASIDITYPIAGQDNDTQGFRDNFRNIRNNLNIAGSEISAIQNSLETLTTSSILRTSVPTSPSTSGTKGQIAFDLSYFYICVDTNTWRRISLSTW